MLLTSLIYSIRCNQRAACVTPRQDAGRCRPPKARAGLSNKNSIPWNGKDIGYSFTGCPVRFSISRYSSALRPQDAASHQIWNAVSRSLRRVSRRTQTLKNCALPMHRQESWTDNACITRPASSLLRQACDAPGQSLQCAPRDVLAVA